MPNKYVPVIFAAFGLLKDVLFWNDNDSRKDKHRNQYLKLENRPSGLFNGCMSRTQHIKCFFYIFFQIPECTSFDEAMTYLVTSFDQLCHHYYPISTLQPNHQPEIVNCFLGGSCGINIFIKSVLSN